MGRLHRSLRQTPPTQHNALLHQLRFRSANLASLRGSLASKDPWISGNDVAMSAAPDHVGGSSSVGACGVGSKCNAFCAPLRSMIRLQEANY